MIDLVSKSLSRLAMWCSAIGLTAMVLIICWQVFARYVLNSSPPWAEQMALLLMLWFVQFAAAAGVREGFHIRILILQDSLSPARRKWLMALCQLIVGLFGLAMAVSGVELAQATWQHTVPTLGISRGVTYIPMVAAGFVIIFFACEHIYNAWRETTREQLWN